MGGGRQEMDGKESLQGLQPNIMYLLYKCASVISHEDGKQISMQVQLRCLNKPKSGLCFQDI